MKIKLVRYYIYAFLDTTKPGTYNYTTSMGNFNFNYEPIYIGKGNGRRHQSHLNEAKNIRLRNLIESGNYECEIVSDELPSHLSYKIESELIYQIGRIDLETGPLVNETAGIYLVNAKRHDEIAPLNLEYNKVIHMLKILNKKRTLGGAAGVLGISPRTLYRYLKAYKLVKDKTSKEYYQDV